MVVGIKVIRIPTVIVTDWNEFKEMDLKRVKKMMRRHIIIDGRNIYEPAAVKRLGFKYMGMGRSSLSGRVTH